MKNSASENVDVPLVVDMDGTLVRSDMLLEAANQFITKNPLRILSLTRWMMYGRLTLKKSLAENTDIDVINLPYNQDLIDWIKTEKEKGRKIVLATASNEKHANAVAEHLNIFDEVYSSNEHVNLKSSNKRGLLVRQYGEKGYDYVGNDNADLAVWKDSRYAYVVGNSKRLLEKANKVSNAKTISDSKNIPYAKSFVKALRMHQWVKNLLVFCPLFASHGYSSTGNIVHALFAFITFCFCASSVYILNDLVDVADDRMHSSKRRRPFASGNLNLVLGWLMWPPLLVMAFVISFLLMSPK